MVVERFLLKLLGPGRLVYIEGAALGDLTTVSACTGPMGFIEDANSPRPTFRF